jgi:hypothetical protein
MKRRTRLRWSVFVGALCCLRAPAPATAAEGYFAIEVIDEATGRGVPLVELRTVNEIRYLTDSSGLAAIDEPGLMEGAPVFFHVSSHGYEFPKDGFGYRGKALNVRAGESARLKMKRINIAERLYRVTGAGIYRDSVLLGRPVPIRQPVLNGRVFGSDSVVNAVYRGKVAWFWGDTNRPGYPLGNFNVPGATSVLPAEGGLEPGRGVDLDYFTGPDGFARQTAPVPGPGPTWIFGLVVLNDSSPGQAGPRERMFAGYSKIRPPMETYERGLVEFNPATNTFEKAAVYPLDAPNYPTGQAFLHTAGGVEYVCFATAYPLTRVKAEPEALKHPEQFEAFTCLAPGAPAEQAQVVRTADGSPRWTWTPGAAAVTPAVQAKLIKAGMLKPEEAILHLRDATTGKPVTAHAGSVHWNAYRKRWVMIVCESWGTSLLGETWYAEADSPLGPWVYARKIVTHEKYSFYNPKQHPMFDQDGGRLIYFEGTYTHTFSGNEHPTPRYDYNQVMYRLDLADPRLNLPVAIYRLAGGGFGPASRLGADDTVLRPAFFALERPAAGSVAVLANSDVQGRAGLLVVGNAGPAGDAIALFHALPADAAEAPSTTVALHALEGADGVVRGYVTADDPAPAGAGARRSERPICRVWKNPLRLALPRE